MPVIASSGWAERARARPGRLVVLAVLPDFR
jgi:hypothetical protein